MKFYSLGHLADGTVASFVPAGSARIRNDVAIWIAYLAEFDRRRLFVPDGYSSLFDYCLRKLEMSEDEAIKYIRVARAARKFPVIFEALADRRLHLSGAVLLARHLRPENVDELLAAAAHRTRAGIEQLIAEHFPSPDVPTVVRVIETTVTAAALAPIEMKSTHDLPAPGRVKLSTTELASTPIGDLGEMLPAPIVGAPRELRAPGRVNVQESHARLRPLAPHRYSLECTFDQEMHDDLERARDLFSSAIPSGDVVQLLGRALKALVREGEKSKFAATSKPRTSAPPADTRRIPANVRRAVRERDGGHCTFVSDSGHRCESRKFLEFDHIEPVARGGQSTVANVRLRCRAHNQFEAERVLGADFMRGKREAARTDRAEAKDMAAAEQAAAEAARAEAAEKARAAADQVRAAAEAQAATERAREEIIPWLRKLGFRVIEAKQAAELSVTHPEASLEERMRLALRHLAPLGIRRGEIFGFRPA